MNGPLPSQARAMERVAALVEQAQAESEQSDMTTGPDLHAQQIVAKLDGLIENVTKSNELLSQARAMERVAALVEQAQAEPEQSDMTTGSGLTYLAEKGNAEAQGFVDALTNPEAQAIYAEGSAHDGLAPPHAPTGASADVRPVPGGEHKGMLKLVEFTQPVNGTVSRNADQTLTFRPKPGISGKDSFDYTLRDEAGTMFSATVTVAVILDAPVVKPALTRAPSLRALSFQAAPRPAPPLGSSTASR